MDLKFVSLPAFVVAATALAASPAFAQRRGGESHANHHSQNRGAAEHAHPRAQAPRPAPTPRVQQAPRMQQAPRYQQAPRVQGRVVPRAEATPRYYSGGVAVPHTSPRSNSYYGHGNYGYGNYGYGNYGYRNYGYGNYGYGNRYYGGRYHVTPWRGWYGYAPFHPYYFRPHFSVGFGVYLGYPVPYYAYPYPVPVYGYGAPYGEVSVGPNNSAYGGVALQIGPNDAVAGAAVYVDGTYAGVVSDFDGTRQPLTLTQGTHHIEIDLNGFQPLAFDATVQPGMVTPYQGSLQPY
jgi:hypothetical protein